MTQKILNRDPKDEILKAFRLFDDDETGILIHWTTLSILFDDDETGILFHWWTTLSFSIYDDPHPSTSIFSLASVTTRINSLKFFSLSTITGKISFKNLKRVAKELGERMTDEELQEMIDEADRDGDGEVNEEEFLRIMKKTNLF